MVLRLASGEVDGGTIDVDTLLVCDAAAKAPVPASSRFAKLLLQKKKRTNQGN